MPIGALIRTLFHERCRDVLLSPANPVADWFDRDALEALLDEHLAGRRVLHQPMRLYSPPLDSRALE